MADKKLDRFIKSDLLESFINTFADALMLTDGSGRILLVNDLVLKEFGLRRENVIGKTPLELINEGVYSNSSVMNAIENKCTVHEVIHIKGGKKKFSTSIPIFDDNGDIELVITNSRSEDVLNSFAKELEAERAERTKLKDITEYLSALSTKNLIYCSAQMESIVSVCNLVAQTESTVMILGESGVGKEVLAKYIHNNSNRKNGMFIPINCAAIPKELFEAELFGYEAHAFTGASDKGKMGLIKMAHKGTLFLDEIGEMPLNMQTKLLRFLSDGKILPIGGTQSEKVDVRVISATNRDINQMVKNKEFRSDLYYRLNVIPVSIPPLRERTEDIELLARFYLEFYNRKYRKEERFSEQDIEDLKSYSWPGNIRELRNIVERIVVLSKGGHIMDILGGAMQGFTVMSNKDAGCTFAIALNYTLRDATSLFQNYYIDRVVDASGGINNAAKTLDVHRSTLYRKKNV